MSEEEVRKVSSRLHRIEDISSRTGSVVTRSVQFARQANAKDNNPVLSHFLSKVEHLADGRDHIDFATGRHTLKSLPADGKNFDVSEFRRLLESDLKEATERAGTRADALEVEKPERYNGITIPKQAPKTQMGAALMSALQNRAAERNQ